MSLEEELEELINKRADEKVSEIKGNIQEYEAWVDGLEDTLRYIESNAREMIKDSKDEGLTINAVEAEGFLRGIITVKNQIESDKKWLKDEN